MIAFVVVVVSALLGQTADAGVTVPNVMPDAGFVGVVVVDAGVGPATVPSPIASLTQTELLRRERAALAALGTYRLRIEKSERFDGVLSTPQVMDVLIRQQPRAYVADVVAGPSRGRRFLYNQALRPRAIRVREAGVLGLAGALWIDVDNPLTRGDSHHPATLLGLGPVLENIGKDQQRSAAAGGHARVDDGADDDGHWCMRFTAPAGVRDLYAQASRICVDPQTFLLTKIEASDAQGVFERFRFYVLQSRVVVDDSAFTPAGAGL